MVTQNFLNSNTSWWHLTIPPPQNSRGACHLESWSLRLRVPGISLIFFLPPFPHLCHSLPLLSVCLSKYSIFCPLIRQRKWCVLVSLFTALIVLGRKIQTGRLSATLCELALRLCVGEVHYACTVPLFWCTSELIESWCKRKDAKACI